MRYLNITAALAAATLLAGAAVAKDKAEGQQPKEKKICRVEVLSNSHIPERRICRTEAEWAAQGEDDARKTESTLRGSRGAGN
jgi:hypothetical protein